MNFGVYSNVLIAIVLVVLTKWLVNFFLKLIRLPAGPWGLPIVGYLPWMDKHVAESFMKISKKYGNIFSVTLGSQTVIVLNDWASVKACLVDQPKNFNGRPPNVTTDTASSRKDVPFSDGPIWEEQRNLMTQCMKYSGMGKSSMENLVKDSIHEVIKIISSCDGKSIEMESLIFMPFMKISWKLVANHHFHTDDDAMVNFNNDISLIFKEFRPDNFYNLFPWLRFLPPNGFGFKHFVEANERIMSYIKNVIKSHLNNWVEGSETDFIDHYILKMKNDEANRKSGAPYTTDYLVSSVWDMFIAGFDTSSATVQWAMLFLSSNPNVQKEAQRELDSVVGRNRLPCLSDFSKLPYMEAVIMEVHRMASVVPLSIPHLNHHSTKIGNITIPKGSTCLQSIYGVHFDANVWKEPKKFDPTRFINEKNEAEAPPYLMPFSIGPRLCIGKAMAEINVKLFVSCLLHQFSFSFCPDAPKPSFDGLPAIVVHPLSYSLIFRERNFTND